MYARYPSVMVLLQRGCLHHVVFHLLLRVTLLFLKAASEPVGWGILGTANIAHKLALAINEVGDTLIAVGSRSIDNAVRFVEKHGGVAVQGYDAVLRQSAVRIVYVPLPTALRTDWVVKACRAGKHVLAEKPFPSTAAVEQMLAACHAQQFMDATHFAHSLRLDGVREAMQVIGPLRRVAASFFTPLVPHGRLAANIRSDTSLETWAGTPSAPLCGPSIGSFPQQ